MGGRFGNSSNYRGRSRSRARPKTSGRSGKGNNRSDNASKKKECKFAVSRHENSSQYMVYGEVKKEILRKFKQDKDLQEISRAMENGQVWDYTAEKPDRRLSQINIFIREREDGAEEGDQQGRLISVRDPEKVEEKRVEQETFDLEFKSELSLWNERVKSHKEGSVTVCNKIMDECVTRSLLTLIEQEPNFETALQDKPVELLDAINRITHNGETTGQYICHTMALQLKEFVTARMDENETPQDWMQRVKDRGSAMSQLFGNRMFLGVIEDSDEYQNANGQAAKDKLLADFWEQFQAYLVLHGAHHLKCGQLSSFLH